MQQQRSGSAIDHGLALMASAYAAPGTQGQIMHSMDNQQPDASSMMNNLVQLQQMQNLQNLPQPGGGAGAGGASTGGMDPRTWALLPPDAKLKIIEQNAQSGLQIQQQGAEEKQKDLLEAQDKAPTQLAQMSDMEFGRQRFERADESGAHQHHRQSNSEVRGREASGHRPEDGAWRCDAAGLRRHVVVGPVAGAEPAEEARRPGVQ